jgi:hypothetical protein
MYVKVKEAGKTENWLQTQQADFDSRQEQYVFFFFTVSRLALILRSRLFIAYPGSITGVKQPEL